MLKEEYTNLKVNYDNLVVSHELLSNEPHDATNNVVKIDIATSCDDLIVESIEQGSNSKRQETGWVRQLWWLCQAQEWEWKA